jgi:nitrate reductase beta subunit
MLKWKLITVQLEMVLNLMHDRCTVCAKHSIARKSFWTHPMELRGDEAQVEARFVPNIP